MQKKLKIFHIYANDLNLGDLASAQGIKLLLKNNFDGSLVFHDKFALTDLSDRDIDTINKNFDGIIIGGGGLLRGDSVVKKNHILGVSFKKLNQINKPKFTYSIGVNYEDQFSEEIKNVAHYFAEKFSANSVRDVLSKKFLSNADLVLCPSMLISPRQKTSNISKKITVGIAPVPLSRVKDPNKYLVSLLKIIKSLQDKKYQVSLITHSKFPEDINYEINKKANIDLFLPSSPSIAMSFYDKCDIILGSRGHSLIFAAGRGIPFINLSYNIKCKEFCDTIKYPSELSLNANDMDDSEVMSRVNYVIDNYEEIQDLLVNTRELAEHQNNNYAKKIINILKN